MKNTSYTDQPCPRCGSKLFISRVWKEKVPTYSGGFTEVECSQIECTNKACQSEFVRQRLEDEKKKEATRQKKKENDANRKAKSLEQGVKSKKHKSL